MSTVAGVGVSAMDVSPGALERAAQHFEDSGFRGCSVMLRAAAGRIRELEAGAETRVSAPPPSGALGGAATLVMALGGERGQASVRQAVEDLAANAGIRHGDVWAMRLVDFAAKVRGR